MRILIYLFLLILLFLNGCTGCSKSGRKSIMLSSKQTIIEDKKPVAGRNIVIMKKKNGVYHIPVEVNGIKMYFIFDTGASTISISEVEALFLIKQEKLTQKDIIGDQKFILADGSISEGTIINLREIKIGNKTLYNIKASVVHNLKSPLLVGQSALEKFGKITIDNEKSVIIFE